MALKRRDEVVPAAAHSRQVEPVERLVRDGSRSAARGRLARAAARGEVRLTVEFGAWYLLTTCYGSPKAMRPGIFQNMRDGKTVKEEEWYLRSGAKVSALGKNSAVML